MWRRNYNSLLFLLAVFASGCIEPYALEGVAGDPDYLVVDGFINATEQTCSVRLSRAVSLDFTETPPGETGAILSVESEDGHEFFLTEVVSGTPDDDAGLYRGEAVSVSEGKQYRLNIMLSNGRRYESDFVRIEKAAEIESLVWEPVEEELRIRVSTTANSSSTSYYRWRFIESWRYNAPRSSNFIIRDGGPQPRLPEENIYTCYRVDPSYGILIGSSQNLSSNVMKNYVLQTIPANSIKLQSKYNLRVEQYALSEEAYTFWLNLYKTTESTGGLFDPMPGQVVGNLKGVTDPSELVVGYFSGSTVEQSSLWISRSDFPVGFVKYRSPYCAPDTLDLEQIVGLPDKTPLVDGIYGPMGGLVAYTIAPPSCVDCRAYGKGTTTKPDFWP